MGDRPTLDLGEAADLLGLHPNTLQARAKSGDIPGAKIGKEWRFDFDQLLDFIRSHYSRKWQERLRGKNFDGLVQSLDSIRQRAIPVYRKPGIYFLFKGDQLMYVGQSENVFRRLGNHSGSDKDFDSFAFIEADIHLLNELEAHYIGKFQPPLNRMLNGG